MGSLFVNNWWHKKTPLRQNSNAAKGGDLLKTPMNAGASSAMKQFKLEVANELGITDYENVDKGNLSSRANGYVGGNMTKKMVAYAEQAMSQGK